MLLLQSWMGEVSLNPKVATRAYAATWKRKQQPQQGVGSGMHIDACKWVWREYVWHLIGKGLQARTAIGIPLPQGPPHDPKPIPSP